LARLQENVFGDKGGDVSKPSEFVKILRGVKGLDDATIAKIIEQSGSKENKDGLKKDAEAFVKDLG
jgi:hypothetical protein